MGDGSQRHSCWKTPDLEVGDEVTVRIVEVPECDSPEYVYDPRDEPESP